MKRSVLEGRILVANVGASVFGYNVNAETPRCRGAKDSQ
jgi:hypothetical protein